MKDLDRVGTLGDLDHLVGGEVAESLRRLAGRPGDRQLGDPRGVAQADRLDEAVAAEAGVIADRAVDRSHLAVART